MQARPALPLACAQCGRTLPAEPGELAGWRPVDLLAAGELDEATAAMLLCPECADDDLRGEYEAGDVD